MAELTQNQRPAPRELVKTLRKWLLSPWSLTALILLIVAVLDPGNLTGVLQGTAKGYFNTLPFILFAVGTVAYLKASGAEAMVAQAFQGRETRMIVLAALFGGLAPFCSCEVIPFIAGLLALGAPLSAVMAFWLSSPLIDPPTIAITAGALGWNFAIAKTIAAVGIGLIGGFAIRGVLGLGAFSNPLKEAQQSGCGCGPSPFDGKPVWKIWQEESRMERFRSEAWSNFVFLTKWLVLAYTLEAILIDYVPAELVLSLIGGEGIGAIGLAALIGMPAYINGYVAPALLSGFVEQGMSPGAALSFMIAGSVSCIPAMAAVWSLVKPPIFASYIALGLFGAVFFGTLFQLVS